MTLVEGLTAAGAIAGPLLGGGVWAYLSQRSKLRAARETATAARPVETLKAEADMTEAAATFAKQFGAAAAGLIDDMRNELRFVRSQVEGLRGEVAECEKHRVACDASLEQVRAEIARLMRDNPPAGY
jgi:chromosome segregation ATPase